MQEPGDMHEQATGEPNHAKKIYIYHNGDRFSTGQMVVVNKRTRNFDAFLNDLSLKPKFGGAVRSLRTPDNGHLISDLDSLESGQSYVACDKKFVKLG